MKIKEAMNLLTSINKFQPNDKNSIDFINIKLNKEYTLCIGRYTYINVTVDDPNKFPMADYDVSSFIMKYLELFEDIIFKIEEVMLLNV